MYIFYYNTSLENASKTARHWIILILALALIKIKLNDNHFYKHLTNLLTDLKLIGAIKAKLSRFQKFINQNGDTFHYRNKRRKEKGENERYNGVCVSQRSILSGE